MHGVHPVSLQRVRQKPGEVGVGDAEQHGLAGRIGERDLGAGARLCQDLVARLRLEVEDLALGGAVDLDVRRFRRQVGPDCVDLTVDGLVVPRRIVVGEGERLHPAQPRHCDHVIERAVAPADLSLVLARPVLRVVDQQIGAGEEFDMALVLTADFPGAISERPGMRLVIAAIDDGHAVRLEPVAEGQRRVVQVLRLDRDVADPEHPLAEVVIADRGPELRELDREIGVLHLAGEHLAHSVGEAVRRVDVPLIARDEKRGEERQALDVVPMGVADQQVAAKRLLPGLHQLRAEGQRTGAAIEHHERARVRPQLDARGIPPVPDGTWPRLRIEPRVPRISHASHRLLPHITESTDAAAIICHARRWTAKGRCLHSSPGSRSATVVAARDHIRCPAPPRLPRRRPDGAGNQYGSMSGMVSGRRRKSRLRSINRARQSPPRCRGRRRAAGGRRRARRRSSARPAPRPAAGSASVAAQRSRKLITDVLRRISAVEPEIILVAREGGDRRRGDRDGRHQQRVEIGGARRRRGRSDRRGRRTA